jgi:hypothetical protein
MGHGGLSNFSRFARRQEYFRGKREIEPHPEQPERSADSLWLEENNKPKPRPPARFNHCLNAAQQSRKP